MIVSRYNHAAILTTIATALLSLPIRSGRSQRPATRALFRVSVSVSPFTETQLRAGIQYTDGRITATTAAGLQRLFEMHGANEVYARISTTQEYRAGSGDHSMHRGLDRARMAKQLGLPLDPELGLFNIYGDVRCQPPPDFSDYPEIKLPGPWSSLTVDQMAAALRLYGTLAAREILSTGVKVRIWDLGNEVEFGTAGVAVQPMPNACDDTAGGEGWYRAPSHVDREIGKMSASQLMGMPEPKRLKWLASHLWPYEGRLLAAVAGGIRSVDPMARFTTHVSGITAGRPEQAVAFYKAMRDAGFEVDEIGMSYYPTSPGGPADRLQAFKDTVTALRGEMGKPVFITEFGYPSGRMSGPFPWNDAVKGYPQNPEGQAAFIRDLVAWGAETGAISGIRPWAPDIATAPWGAMGFFDLKGRTAVAKPALNAISEGLALANNGRR